MRCVTRVCGQRSNDDSNRIFSAVTKPAELKTVQVIGRQIRCQILKSKKNGAVRDGEYHSRGHLTTHHNLKIQSNLLVL